MNTTLESPSSVIQKPRKVVVPISTGLAWGNEFGFLYQEKVDGRFATQEIVDQHFVIAKLAGEQMADGTFYAFDILEYLGEDFREKQLWMRHVAFDLVMEHSRLPDNVRRVQSAKDGGKLLAEVLARGGEGVVRKDLASPWGTVMEACKRLETFTCVVTGFNAGQSVQIALSGQPCGNVSLFGGKCDRVRIGSILKIEGFGLTRDGKIREPRPCKDAPTSWLIQY